MCEINSHGGNVIVRKILELCLKNGAELAEPGEFTKRAFLNGRIDLLQAESVIDYEVGYNVTANKINANVNLYYMDFANELILNGEVGTNGLPKIGIGDWNDGFSNIGPEGKGESVWLTEFCAIICFRFSVIARKIKGEKEERFFLEIAEKLSLAVKNSFVDGWYLRGYYDSGAPLGKLGNRECEIDSLSQSFAAFMEFTMNGEVSESTKCALEKAFLYLYDTTENLIFQDGMFHKNQCQKSDKMRIDIWVSFVV